MKIVYLLSIQEDQHPFYVIGVFASNEAAKAEGEKEKKDRTKVGFLTVNYLVEPFKVLP